MKTKQRIRFQPTFDLYLRYANGAFKPQPWPHDSAGPDGMEAFWCFESEGKRIPSCEPEIVARACAGKENFGLQKTMWVETRKEDIGGHLVLPLLEWVYMCERLRLPDWVFNEVEKRAGRRWGFSTIEGATEHIMRNWKRRGTTWEELTAHFRKRDDELDAIRRDLGQPTEV